MVDSSKVEQVIENVTVQKKFDSNVCPLSDNYFTKCPVMRTYYYLIEDFFASWSWSG
ncbi:MAG: hypothetical protein ACC653_02235 [Gammaproteobacteria bacterium]